MNMRITLISFLLCTVAFGLRAQQVDTITIHSNAMDNDVKNIIILPSDYYENQKKSYPVLYLLHGYNNDYRSWLRIKPELPELASQYGIIIVCPDGKSSWYWDSPVGHLFVKSPKKVRKTGNCRAERVYEDKT